MTRYVSKQKEEVKMSAHYGLSPNKFELQSVLSFYYYYLLCAQFSTDFDSENRRSVCLASRDFGNSEQVFIFYGRRTCAEQLIHNGFVDVNNSYDALALRIGLSKSDPLAQQRTDLLRKLRILTGI